MISQTIRGGASAALAIVVLTACAPQPNMAQAPAAAPTPEQVREAGLVALDLLAPAWGVAARGVGPCDARYTPEALSARCDELMKDPGALSTELPKLEDLAVALRESKMTEADEAWLRAADAVFIPLIGRAPPKGAKGRKALTQLDAQLRPMLARPAPSYGAASAMDVLSPEGEPLTAAELKALEPFVDQMKSALKAWDKAARGASLIRVAEYGAMIARRNAEGAQ